MNHVDATAPAASAGSDHASASASASAAMGSSASLNAHSANYTQRSAARRGVVRGGETPAAPRASEVVSSSRIEAASVVPVVAEEAESVAAPVVASSSAASSSAPSALSSPSASAVPSPSASAPLYSSCALSLGIPAAALPLLRQAAALIPEPALYFDAVDLSYAGRVKDLHVTVKVGLQASDWDRLQNVLPQLHPPPRMQFGRLAVWPLKQCAALVVTLDMNAEDAERVHRTVTGGATGKCKRPHCTLAYMTHDAFQSRESKQSINRIARQLQQMRSTPIPHFEFTAQDGSIRRIPVAANSAAAHAVAASNSAPAVVATLSSPSSASLSSSVTVVEPPSTAELRSLIVGVESRSLPHEAILPALYRLLSLRRMEEEERAADKAGQQTMTRLQAE